MEKYVIIVAGGSGKRVGAAVPKQFIEVGGKPILMHTLQVFYDYDPQMHLILVLPQDHFSTWQQLCQTYHFSIPHGLVEGGKERFFSVKNGLDYVPAGALVAVHDGVRPFVSKKTIFLAFSSAELQGSGIPVIPEIDSLRKVSTEGSQAVDRKNYYRVQTPQVFQSTLLKEAYNQEFSSQFTDDASVLEASGQQVYISRGNVENIKITTPMDLKWATLLLQEQKEKETLLATNKE